MRLHAVLLALLVAGCGPSASASPDSPDGTATSSATGGGESSARTYPGPDRPWAELDQQARAHHMSRHVVPAMSELFLAYDAERFGELGCPTCHGADARERHYAMPNPSLPVLYPTGSVGQHRTVAQFPDGVRFMYNEVMPAMRQLVGAPEYDESTHEGFTCFGCHVRAADDDPLSQPE